MRKFLLVLKQEFVKTFYRYFEPLGERWFWVYAFPIILILSVVLVLLEKHFKQ